MEKTHWRRTKDSRRSVGLNEIWEVSWSEVIESFICEKKNFEVNAKFDNTQANDVVEEK